MSADNYLEENIQDEVKVFPAEFARNQDEAVPYLSVVIPVYNEEDNIQHLYDELSAALQELDCSYEVIVIDDGSQDRSYIELKRVYEQDERWRILRMRRNFGQTAGLSAGFDAARGQVVITMDADLQNDPRDMGKLLEKIYEGYDIASGWRVNRKNLSSSGVCRLCWPTV